METNQMVCNVEEHLICNLGNKEIKQIEEWTGMKIGNIIFDSDVDNWNINSSGFDEKIMNKSNLILLIEDDDGNLFGGYVNTIIDKYQSWIHDPKSFVFSLKSNGRLNGMLKFEIQVPQYSFYLNDKTEDCLFGFGGYEICVGKEKQKTKSHCYQYSYNYNGIENALCGKLHPLKFAVKKVITIQLIYLLF